MKPNKKITFAFGLVLFISIILAFALYNKTSAPQELSFDEALTKIKNKEASEVTVRQDMLVMTGKTNEKFAADLDASDAARIAILEAANETGTTIKLEPASSGWGWLLFINALPFIMMSAVTLAAVIYIVKTLTKNKG